MPRQPKWVGEDLYNLLTLGWPEFHKLYPEEKKNTWKGKKVFWRKKVNNGEIEMPEKEPVPSEVLPIANQSTVEQIGDNLVSTVEGWYEVVTKDSEGVAQVHRLYKHSTKTRPNPLDTLEELVPATPARITPTRRLAPKRDHRVYVAMGDCQIDFRRLDDNSLEPLHDENAMRVARLICSDLRPDEIVNLGDHVDLSALSRFAPDSDHFFRTMTPAFQAAHDWYAGLRADNPQAKLVEVSSNHEIRLRNWVLKNMPQVYGFMRPGAEEEYPVMTYPYLANLAHVGVDFIGGYEAAEYHIGGNADLIARHGRETSSNGTVASKIMKNFPETNNIHGHSHEMGTATKTLRNGKILSSVAVGALCRTDGVVPGYHSAVDDLNQPVHRQQNWQQSILAVYDYGNGRYQFDHIPIVNGTAYYLGKEYDANSK